MEKKIVLFDGVCNLCNGSVQFIIKHDTKNQFSFASLQSRYAEELLKSYKPQTTELYSIILVEGGKIYEKSTAVLRIARTLSGLWPALYAFMIVPPFIRNFFYDLVAKNRYRLFGKADECWLPSPELRAKFLS